MIEMKLLKICTGLVDHISRVALILAGIFVSSGCENDMATVRRISTKQEAEIEVGKNIDAFYSDFGRVKAQLSAPVMNHVIDPKNPYSEMPSGLHLQFYSDSMKVQSDLTAGYGISYDKSDQMIARNNVVVNNIYGEKLETEELIWDQNTEKISSEKFVKITTRDEIIFGDGFESNDDLSNYKIKKIRGTLQVTGDQL